MRTILISTAAIALLGALPAHAQLGGSLGGRVGGGLGGAASAAGSSVGSQVGGSIGGSASGSVGAPNVGAATGAARGAVNGAVDTARGTASDARGIATGTANTAASTNVGATVNASGNASASQNGASAAVDLGGGFTLGMPLLASGGQTAGQVVGVVKNRAGQVRTIVVQTADGVRRSLPSSQVDVQGNAAVSGYSEARIDRLPRTPQ